MTVKILCRDIGELDDEHIKALMEYSEMLKKSFHKEHSSPFPNNNSPISLKHRIKDIYRSYAISYHNDPNSKVSIIACHSNITKYKYYFAFHPLFNFDIENQHNEPQPVLGTGAHLGPLPINDNMVSVNQHIIHERNYYLFKNNIYYFDPDDMHTEDEQKLLVKEHYFKEEKKFRKLQKEIRLFEKMESMEIQRSREPIPEEVRFAVWRRDQGKCVKCGSKKNLEFDHIIPVSEGGSNTERNIQILCQKCNREKSNKI